MRKIYRKTPPVEFSKWVAKNKTAHWSDFVTNNHDLYEIIRDLLKQDQYGVSGYTEKPLKKEHIDHFKTRNFFPGNEFDWYNLIVDERDETRFGSGTKDKLVIKDDYDKNLIINPIKEDPHYFFTYMENGEIIPRANLNNSEKARAERTIELFNLNHPVLVDCRMGIIRCFNDVNGVYTIDQMENDYNAMGFFSLYDFYRENKNAFKSQP